MKQILKTQYKERAKFNFKILKKLTMEKEKEKNENEGELSSDSSKNDDEYESDKDEASSSSSFVSDQSYYDEMVDEYVLKHDD